MHQSLDVNLIECDKDAEPSDAGNRARKCFAETILHVIALEPCSHIARGFIGAALGRGTLHAQQFPRHFRVVGRVVQNRLECAMR